MEAVAFARRVFDVGQQVRERADDPVAVIIVAHGDGDGVQDGGVFADVLDVRRSQQAGRRFHVENGVQHELELGTARAEHGIEARVDLAEVPLGLGLHHPDGHEQSPGERDGERRDDGGQGVLAKTAKNDGPEVHRFPSFSFSTSPSFSFSPSRD